ncbi:FkbM family methyltransferase [Pseudaminobacter sp. NGMCC 1.201702]|uniref:FkbM family methyltransferase n=1 Tax=Pseudaminobacter sp. NGMCC 1.201702 TaxID=3391825 RepID=UPI0039EF465E
MLRAVQSDIVIDAQTGRVEGARAGERVAIHFLRMALQALMPFHNFGFSYIARATRGLLPSTRAMVFALDSDSRMRVRYCDAYWSTLLAPNYPYEPSIRALLADSRDVGYGFIDGGANHGFWSILASGKRAGSKPCVAVEAASDTFRYLEDNRQINGERFSALNKAIGATSGEHVRIYGAKHEARSTVAPSTEAVPILDCETITVDDISAMPDFDGLEKFVVKLDVEGAEIAAFSGASRLLGLDTAFVYEEHGSDSAHEVTRHVLEALKLRVFWLGKGKAREIHSLDELDQIKKSRRFGYDMVASRSPFWIERLERLVGTSATQH